MDASTHAEARAPRGAYALAVTSILFWGTSFAFTKVALASISPVGLVAVRSILGLAVALAALLLLPRRAAARSAPGDAVRVVLLGVLGIPLQVGLQAYALTLTSATHTGWIVAVSPVSTAALAALFLGERFPLVKLGGVLVGFAGVSLVMSAGTRPALSLPATRGDLLVLASALNWSVYTLIGREMMKRRAPLPLTAWILACGAAPTVAAYMVLGHPIELSQIHLRGWLVLAYLGTGCSGLGYICWSAALEKLEAGRLSSFQNLQPLIAAMAAWWLGEPVGAAIFAGGLLVLSGVFLVQRGAKT